MTLLLTHTGCLSAQPPTYRTSPVSAVAVVSHLLLLCYCPSAPGANPYLTFHCASQGTVLIDLATDDKEFQSVEEEVCTLHHDLFLQWKQC